MFDQIGTFLSTFVLSVDIQNVVRGGKGDGEIVEGLPMGLGHGRQENSLGLVEKVYESKGEGGLGMIEIRKFNLALF